MWKGCRRRKWPNGWIAPRPRCGRTSRTHAPSSASTSREGSGKRMKHPNQAALALYAGGDLGFFARWRVERHLAKCEPCGEEVASFEATREIVTDLSEIPDIHWNGLAAEMKANIRLGLAAGECVRIGQKPLRERPLFKIG